MGSRERIFAALRREEPDRTPISELLIHQQVFEALDPGASYYEFVENAGFDAVGPNCTWDSLGRVEWVDEENQVFVDRWGVTRRLDVEMIPTPLKGAIDSREDLLRYRVPDPAEEPLLKLIPELVGRFGGKKATFILGRDAWTGSYMVRGMTNLLMDLICEPKLARDIIRINVEYYKEVHRLAIESGIDIVHLVDDYAFKSGTLMSPELWKAFIYPGFCEIVEDIKKRGAWCCKHTDGNIWAVIDWIVDSGIDALGPLEPEANMDLARVKERYGHKVALYGNVSCDLLARGNPEQVGQAVRKLLAECGPGGGYILSSGNTISSSTRPENLREMLRSALLYGEYPMRTGC